jgi:hypothetical protein
MAERAAPAVRLLDLPFDQYGRHRDAQTVADLIRAEQAGAGRGGPLVVLDVGGYPCLTPRFLPADRVVVVDPQPVPGGRGYLRANGEALPFPDDAFDLALSLDSLEHVAPARRPQYLAELLRVTRRYVLLLAPFASSAVERAEALLFEYVKVALHADHAQLREHRDHGLPALDATRACLEAVGAACVSFPSGYLPHWLALMLLKHHLLSLDPDAGVHAALDRWYNALDGSADRWLPAYRYGLLARKGGPAPLLAEVAGRFAAAPRDALADL